MFSRSKSLGASIFSFISLEILGISLLVKGHFDKQDSTLEAVPYSLDARTDTRATSKDRGLSRLRFESAWDGFGRNTTSSDSDGPVLHISPRPAKSPAETHSGCWLAPRFDGPVTVSVRIQVLEQLRKGSPANPWECPWVFLHYQDKDNCDYIAVKWNGLEYGRRDRGVQTFFRTANESLDLSVPHVLDIDEDGATIRVSLDGGEESAWPQDPHMTGRVGFYGEDCRATFSAIRIGMHGDAINPSR